MAIASYIYIISSCPFTSYILKLQFNLLFILNSGTHNLDILEYKIWNKNLYSKFHTPECKIRNEI